MYKPTESDLEDEVKRYSEAKPELKKFCFTDGDKIRLLDKLKKFISYQDSPNLELYELQRSRKVDRFLNGFQRGSNVLLLGVACGRETKVAKENYGFNVCSITLGGMNVWFGRNILGLSESELSLCIAELLPFSNDFFDVVAGFQVFEHTFSPLLFVLEQARVLKPGGSLILEWPPAKDFGYDSNWHHQVCYAPGQAESLFKKAGLESIVLKYSKSMLDISDEDKWRCDQDETLYISGVKPLVVDDKLKDFWSLE